MKNIIILFLSLFISTTLIQAQAKNDKKVKTETIDVSGTCNMCKKRIEKAAYVKGVRRVDWNKETQKLEIVYNPNTVSIEELSKKIASAGHDANGIHADEKAYEALPNCCAYKSGATCTH